MRINVGSGNCPIEGYVNLDRKSGGEAFPLSQNSIVFDTCVADEIRASHVLEHFCHTQTRDVLREWIRVLKPGGVLKVAVPDLAYAVNNLGKHEHAENWILGGHMDGNDFHGAVFTLDKIETLFEELGLREVGFWRSDARDCSSLPVSINVQGIKNENHCDVPKPVIRSKRKIIGVMSLPRLKFSAAGACIDQAFGEFGIEFRSRTGALWEQHFQNLIEDCIQEGYDDIIALDYDSIFSVDQFHYMLNRFAQNPQIDALSCIQPRRLDCVAMLSGPNATETIEGDLKCVTIKSSKIPNVTAKTAHFGLTFLRAEKIKAMPMPWFLSQPGKNGSWREEDGKVDADIYFWKKWEECGNNLYLLPEIRIGHLQEVVSQIGKDGNVFHTFPGDFDGDPFGGKKTTVIPRKE